MWFVEVVIWYACVCLCVDIVTHCSDKIMVVDLWCDYDYDNDYISSFGCDYDYNYDYCTIIMIMTKQLQPIMIVIVINPISGLIASKCGKYF